MGKESLPSESSYLHCNLVGLMIAAQRIMGVHGGPTKYGRSNTASNTNDPLTKLGLSQECKGCFTLENVNIKFAMLIGLRENYIIILEDTENI